MFFFDAIGWKSADRRLYIETLLKLSRLATDASPNAVQEFQQVVDGAAAKAKQFPQRLITGMFLPALGKVPNKFLALDARRRAAMVALAVERHRLANGSRPPESLAAISAELLPTIPTDPFDGQPLRYRRLGQGYVIYAVGQDLRDNDGKERPKNGTDKTVGHDETFFVER